MTSGPKNATWLGHDIQNAVISLMAETLRERIKEEVHTVRYLQSLLMRQGMLVKQSNFLLSSGIFFMATPTSASFPLLNVRPYFYTS